MSRDDGLRKPVSRPLFTDYLHSPSKLAASNSAQSKAATDRPAQDRVKWYAFGRQAKWFGWFDRPKV
jgi:hypothetical protein